MVTIKDPRQEQLFDPFAHLFSPLAYKTIQNGWQGVFRHVILELMPAEALALEFDAAMGRPTKELYSVAGLVFIMEFEDWTKEEAAAAYMFRSDLWYALNLGPGGHSLSVRTLERYQEIFRESELAKTVMHDVTLRLVELLEQDISKQRLDSTHVFSDMATFGRTRLMGVTVKRFLTQVKRSDSDLFGTLPEALRERYRPSEHQLFADAMKDKDSRKLARQQVAEDMHSLIELFGADERFNGRSTFKTLCTFFERNKHRMTYAEFRARGLPIGSGPVEAACKSLVKTRMGRSGMRWSRQGGQRILDLRTYEKSHRWDQFWKQYKQLKFAA